MADKKNTYLQLIDPRTKFSALVLLGVQCLFLQSSWTIFATAITVATAIIVSPITIRMLLKQAKRVIWFVLFTLLINTFTIDGQVLFEIWGMYGTSEGLLQGVFLSTRIVLLLLLSYVFVRTTRMEEMLDGVEAVFSPFGKRFSSLLVMLSLTINFVPLLIQSAQRIKGAQMARGADVDSSFFRQVTFASAAVLPLFVSAFRTSQHLAEAMDARCYSAVSERTPFNRLKMNSRDWILLSALFLIFIVLTRLP